MREMAPSLMPFPLMGRHCSPGETIYWPFSSHESARAPISFGRLFKTVEGCLASLYDVQALVVAALPALNGSDEHRVGHGSRIYLRLHSYSQTP